MRYPSASSHFSAYEFDQPDHPSNRPIQTTENQPLQTPGSRFSGPVGSYGSIVASPRPYAQSPDIGSLRLPDPAIDPNQDYVPPSENLGTSGPKNSSPVLTRRVTSAPPESNLTKVPTSHNSPLHRETTPEDTGIPPEALRVSPNTPGVNRAPQFIRRVFSYAEDPSPADSRREVEKRNSEFFTWLDDELNKIDDFYRKKEEEAKERYDILHHQLHVMSRNRQGEMKDAKHAAEGNGHDTPHRPKVLAVLNAAHLKDTLKETLTGKSLRFGKNSESLAQLETPGIRPRDREFMFDRREHMQHQDSPTKDPGYRTAKHQLKVAMQEFYRGIDLLRGYANLNQTAFRKINKKYDKAVNAEKPLEYMTERVNKSYFVRSGETAEMMRKVEDWYGRYFEAGNTKIAATKLRSATQKPGDFSPNTFRAGLFLMAGLLFSIQALVHAANHLLYGDLTLQVHTSYLLQVCDVFALPCPTYCVTCTDLTDSSARCTVDTS